MTSTDQKLVKITEQVATDVLLAKIFNNLFGDQQVWPYALLGFNVPGKKKLKKNIENGSLQLMKLWIFFLFNFGHFEEKS